MDVQRTRYFEYDMEYIAAEAQNAGIQVIGGIQTGNSNTCRLILYGEQNKVNRFLYKFRSKCYARKKTRYVQMELIGEQ